MEIQKEEASGKNSPVGQPGFEPGTPSPPDLYAKPTALLPVRRILKVK